MHFFTVSRQRKEKCRQKPAISMRLDEFQMCRSFAACIVPLDGFLNAVEVGIVGGCQGKVPSASRKTSRNQVPGRHVSNVCEETSFHELKKENCFVV